VRANPGFIWYKDDKWNGKKQVIKFMRKFTKLNFCSPLTFPDVKGIDMDRALEESMRDIILGRISYILEQIGTQDDVHILVHEVRKTIKRIRAVLKMVRDEIGYSNYFRENSFYRDMGRSLSPVRDSYVLGALCTALHRRYPDVIGTDDHQAVMECLTRKMEQELQDFNTRKGGFEAIKRDLDSASGRVAEYCRLRDGFVSVEKGIRRIYGRARRQLSRVRKQFHTAEFHEYRKNTKYLLHQVEILQPVYPRVLKAYARSIEKHAELLGETRDYDRLEAYLRTGAENEIRDRVRSVLLKKTDLHRKEMLQKVLARAPLIFAETPGAFIKRLGKYWVAGYNWHTK
jgi:CHAD domain-containing protein